MTLSKTYSGFLIVIVINSFFTLASVTVPQQLPPWQLPLHLSYWTPSSAGQSQDLCSPLTLLPPS